MEFQSIFSVTGADHSDEDLTTAAGLCAEVGAHLSVLIIPPPLLLMSSPPPEWNTGRAQAIAVPNYRFQQIEKFSQDVTRMERRSADILKRLKAMSLSCDVDTDYCDPASLGEVARQRALCADLTIVGGDLLNDETLGPPVVNGCLFDSGKPVLIVPKGAKATLSPRRVLVGWDSRVEASRAVREALSILSAAKEVCVAMVDPKAQNNGKGAQSGADIAAYLTRHGARVSVDLLKSAGKSAGTVLTQHANDICADMMVMGAYGSRGLRERIFGGPPSWSFGNTTLPLFLAR
ncbi:universal stress protein [Mesorhizobium sp.]|uniref:universal stress protein n=1 Tax=Mesorhizobium sp. TaxID=1871066 RepID=UPI000FE8BB26|nr:universal stress protein [Mesorhizobium sp.]RWN06303.1 MAG: universal stress protein [Mesorhizobium sp.]RWN09073.1 MAG: universal stress protein [Mesorhizobium sp.]